MIGGARQGAWSRLRRLTAAAMARDLTTFVVPGPDIAGAHGLDIEAAGFRLVASPRHASVLLVIGEIPPALCEAAAVVYAQMMRPRAVLSLGAQTRPPLPSADITVGLSQHELIDGMRRIGAAMAEGAFGHDASVFDAPVLRLRIEYTCPMHPDVVRDEPGQCPKCGMNLVRREVQAGTPHPDGHKDAATEPAHQHQPPSKTERHAAGAYTCPMHPEVVQDGPGQCPKCGMDLEPREPQPAAPHHQQHTGHASAVEYTCPMHPEVVQDGPGQCPKCGMNLEQRESQPAAPHHQPHAGHASAVEYTCPMHPEVAQDGPGQCPKCGMDLEPRESQPAAPHHQQHAGHASAVEYTCPMHPEMVQDGPGQCPKCGMDLEPREPQPAASHHQQHTGHTGHDGHDGHDGMNHGEMGFMSMIEVTKDLPRSRDGLQMEWVDAPFGPYFPGLPSGLVLSLTLDGDTVAAAKARSLAAPTDWTHPLPLTPRAFVEHVTNLNPMSPLAYRLLACRALEQGAHVDVPPKTTRGRIGALERERLFSHLGWLSLFGRQIGLDWLVGRAAALQIDVRDAECTQITASKPAIQSLINRLQSTPLLRSRTKHSGHLAPDDALRGPIARASGVDEDARNTDTGFTELGFVPAIQQTGDNWARLQVRLAEIDRSLALIEAADIIATPETGDIGQATGNGNAVVETPRGPASLQITLQKGQVTEARLETPSTAHLDLIESLIAQQGVGIALTTVCSLDISPWEVQQ